MNERDESIQSGDIRLEGVLALPDGGGPHPGVVVCHPHPQYGGDMDNNVVQIICAALHALGIAMLRFNFRGVGRSGGAYNGGRGEAEDAAAALRHLEALPEIDPGRVGLAGYSFGAAVALNAATGARALCLVSPPVRMVSSDRLAAWPGPVLAVSGDADHVAPGEELTALVESAGGSVQLERVPGADHFWWDHERELGEAVGRFFRQALHDRRAD